MNSVLLSSVCMEWETPDYFYDVLNSEFHFDLDPCASFLNHKCTSFFTVDDDGLSQSWQGFRAFVNPPYGRSVGKWAEKCADHFLHGGFCVLLIPARTDTNYFHDFILPYAELRFVRGRLMFSDPSGRVGRAPFASMVCVYDPLLGG